MRYDDFLFIDSTNKKVELLNHVIAILHFSSSTLLKALNVQSRLESLLKYLLIFN
jgi:hypothetical protein